MNYTKWLLCMVALVVATTAMPAWAQTPFVASPTSGLAPSNKALPEASPSTGTDPSDTILTIKKRVDEVNVLFIATDHHGKFVRNLNQGDFTILDDHQPPQSIVNFRRETDLPLELGLLVDTSGSVHSRFDFEQEAAVSFLQHTLRANFDKAFVMGFSSHSQVTQDFTDSVRLLETAVRSLHNGGGTALYDAIYRACREKLSKDRGDHPVRRAIIVISDGEDNQSEVTKGIVAADPNVLPLGTVIRLASLGHRYNGTYRVMDTGSRVRGRRLDLYLPDCAEAVRFGRRSGRVSIAR